MKNLKKLMGFVAIASASLLATGCNNVTVDSGKTSTSTSAEAEGAFYITYKGEEITADTAKTAYVGDTNLYLVPHMSDDSTSSFTYTSSNEAVATVSTTGLITAITAGTTDITVTQTGTSNVIKITFTIETPVTSTGAVSYANESYAEKARILSTLESYAVNNYLTGITMFSNGGYVCYNTRYTPKPTEYVTGYGWGTLREGSLSAELPNAAGKHPTYYTIETTAIPGKSNAMNASGSDVSNLAGNIQSSYYSSRLNATNDGYEWYPNLATDAAPIAIDASGNATDASMSSRWRIHLRKGVKYVTGAKTSTLLTTDTKTQAAAAFDGTEVSLDDYLTPFKVMLTGWNNQYRASDLTDGTAGFVGAADYYNNTAKNTTGDSTSLWNEDEWEKSVGDNIKVGTDSDGNWYIDFNLLYSCTQFYAMYNLSSNLYSPIPADFIKVWGMSNYGTQPNGYGLAETTISTGPYYIDYYKSFGMMTLKKNPYYYYNSETLSDGSTRNVYQIPGIDYVYNGDSSKLEDAFLSGKCDTYAPTKQTMSKYRTDDDQPTTGTGTSTGVTWKSYKTKGDSNFKLNVNASTQDEWNSKFGTTGTVYAHASSDVRTVKPYMSDHNFLDFLSFSMDRQTICTSRGMTPTQEYFSDNYLIDPETGVSYNSTDAHKAVLANRHNETYGYDSDAAANSLHQAFIDTIVPLAKAGKLPTQSSSGQAGSSSNPYIVPIDMNWMNATDETDYGDVFDGIKAVFASVSKKYYYSGYVLEINQIAGTSDYNEVYNKMKQGEFDLGFGAISGGDLNPINFMEVLKSDNSSGFTLNWGPDTSKVDSSIVYDGKTWSYDSLWNAADSAVTLATDGSIAGLKNESTKNTTESGMKYESISTTDASATYKLSFKTLIQGGADASSIVVTISNSGDNKVTYTMTELEALGFTKANDYTSNLTIAKNFNTTDGSESTDKDLVSRIVSTKISYNVTIGSSTFSLSSTMKLATYYGIKN